MVDFHSHIINDTDDGSKGFSESVALLYEAKKAGFDTVICTPHYMMGFYEKDVKPIVYGLLSSCNCRYCFTDYTRSCRKQAILDGIRGTCRYRRKSNE